MSISIFNSQVKVFGYVPPREKCARPTLCPFRVRTHQVLLRTHMCVCTICVVCIVCLYARIKFQTLIVSSNLAEKIVKDMYY